jgi:hypothetical protein|tara:strand:+ start:8429 stop:8614 length:186 start_codon:yes stop_codon:yes gene_type:complete
MTNNEQENHDINKEIDDTYQRILQLTEEVNNRMLRMQIAVGGLYVFSVVLVLVDIFLFEAH